MYTHRSVWILFFNLLMQFDSALPLCGVISSSECGFLGEWVKGYFLHENKKYILIA